MLNKTIFFIFTYLSLLYLFYQCFLIFIFIAAFLLTLLGYEFSSSLLLSGTLWPSVRQSICKMKGNVIQTTWQLFSLHGSDLQSDYHTEKRKVRSKCVCVCVGEEGGVLLQSDDVSFFC